MSKGSSSTSSSLPDYYAILHVPTHANFNDILKNYQRLALQLHPELHPDDPAVAVSYAELNQAYFVLSDKHRRKQYDQARQTPTLGKHSSPPISSLLFPAAAAEHMDFFDDVFATLIEAEVTEEQRTTTRGGGGSVAWRSLGAMSGATLGFIMANIPGAAVGAVAGYKAGQVRDVTGRSVMDAWHAMNAEKRRTILNRLVQKFLF